MSEEGAHDWWHTHRVWSLAKRIGESENADLLVVELAALLHDIADWKAHGGDLEAGPQLAREWLRGVMDDTETISKVCDVIRDIPFRGDGAPECQLSLEGAVVQDADRLDAMGAIGIARAFAYGGAHGRAIYDPGVECVRHSTAHSYVNTATPSINHFYEKLLLLKNRMNTRLGRAIAESRHQFMVQYLAQFFQEMDGKDWDEEDQDPSR